MTPFGYLLDEHVNPAYRQAIKRNEPEIEVWRIGEPGAPARHALDPAILLWCEQNNCILITNNRASMPVHLVDHLEEGRHVPGIFVLNPDLSMGQTVDELVLIWTVSDTDEYTDRIEYLPLSY